jgi:hypothetical protein
MLFTIEYVKLLASLITNILRAISPYVIQGLRASCRLFRIGLKFVRVGIQSLRDSGRLPYNGTYPLFADKGAKRRRCGVVCCFRTKLLSPKPRIINWSSRGIQTKTIACACSYRHPKSRGTYRSEGHLPSAVSSLAACKVAANSSLHNAGTTQSVLGVIRP